MEAFLQLFGEMKVTTVVLCVTAVVFLWKIYKSVEVNLSNRFKEQEERERKLQEVIDQTQMYPLWHEQSLAIQQQFSDAITRIKEGQNRNTLLLEKLSKELGENEATTSRYRILRFSDEILHGAKHSKEHFDQVLDDITTYKRYCEEHTEYQNNKAELAIENIKATYKKCCEEGVFS